GNYKNPDTIAKWRAERAAELPAELRKKSSLEPLLGGLVLVVAIAVDDQAPKALVAPSGDETGERTVLEQLERGLVRYPDHPLVAWNGCGFDWPFLGKRAIRHGLFTLARRCWFSHAWGDAMHIDPRLVWRMYDRNTPGRLTQVARFLGIQVGADLD